MSKIIKKEIKIDDLVFTVRIAGMENKGDLIIFLHGFPESSIIWEKTMQKFADLGYRCIAPNQRGYSIGARPQGYENYALNLLVEDVFNFTNGEKIHLVGHDMGAVVGWAAVTMYPERIKSWSALSVPYWPAYFWAIQNDSDQQKKGAYVKMFQESGKPEQILAANDYAVLRKLWSGFDQNNVKEYLEIFSSNNALTSVVNWYRALFMVDSGIVYNSVDIPTMFIWGNQDLAIARAGVERNHAYMKGEYQFNELNAGHWLTEFNEKEVSELLINHINKYSKK